LAYTTLDRLYAVFSTVQAVIHAY